MRMVMFADSHNTLNKWKNYFPQLLNVYRVNVRQMEIHIAVPLVPQPSPSEVETGIANLK
jgi:hypothetical protein